MYKHLSPHKISKLLAFSLALSFSSLCAAETAPVQTEIAETVAASNSAAEEIPTHYSLNLDAASFRQETVDLNGLPFAFRLSDQNLYTAYPASTTAERLDIYIPEAYFHKKSINGFTAKTAPILMPLTLVAGNSAAAAEDEDKTLIFQALEHGYVVAVPHKLVLQPSKNERLGKAPLYLLEAKASIRYLRRNHHRLPAGDLSRIAVTGQGLGGALALQLAASCNQEDYHPYLRGLGSAERSDHIFAALAYEPDLATVQDVNAYGWLLPDGRPDPYAVSRYLPLVDLKDTLAKSVSDPNIDSAIAKIVSSDEEIIDAMDGTLPTTEPADYNVLSETPLSEDNQPGQPNQPDQATQLDQPAQTDQTTQLDQLDQPAQTEQAAQLDQTEISKEPIDNTQIPYDTKEYQDFLAKQAAYEEIEAEYQQFLLDNLPLSQNAKYVRLCDSSSDSAQNSQDLKTAFEETGTKTEILTSCQQNPTELFAWIDAIDAEQDIINEELAKLRKEHNEKLARAKLLMNRASAKAKKKQAALKRQAARNAASQTR